MRRALAPLLLSLLVCAVSGRAQDDSDKDAPLGTQSPATVAWRTPAPAAGGVPALAHATGSDALLASAHAVLTLPGIAGFVLSIGMAVDANVLIFERLKEELWSGKSLRAAVKIGFKRAFTAVFDSHVTTIVGAGVLFLLGTGTVKGFAYTLFWGTVLSLFTAVFVTRFLVDVIVERDLITDQKAYGA